jgi:hypothetical protein
MGNLIMRLRTRKATIIIIEKAIIKTTKGYDKKIHLLIPIERNAMALS